MANLQVWPKIQRMSLSQLEDLARSFGRDHESKVKEHDILPTDHTLSIVELQQYVMSMIASSEVSDPRPLWKGWMDFITRDAEVEVEFGVMDTEVEVVPEVEDPPIEVPVTSVVASPRRFGSTSPRY